MGSRFASLPRHTTVVCPGGPFYPPTQKTTGFARGAPYDYQIPIPLPVSSTGEALTSPLKGEGHNAFPSPSGGGKGGGGGNWMSIQLDSRNLLMLYRTCDRIGVVKAPAGKRMDQRDKEILTARIKEVLAEQPSVLFAYLYGSFLGEGPFRDIDVAAYVAFEAFADSDEMFRYGLSLAARTDLAVSGVTVDLRLLNLAPTPFKFGVVSRGQLIFARDDERRVDFEARTRGLYFDFLPHLRLHHMNLASGEEHGSRRE
jgi:uncharacterized protein